MSCFRRANPLCALRFSSLLQGWRKKLAKNKQSPVRQHRSYRSGLCELFYRRGCKTRELTTFSENTCYFPCPTLHYFLPVRHICPPSVIFSTLEFSAVQWSGVLSISSFMLTSAPLETRTFTISMSALCSTAPCRSAKNYPRGRYIWTFSFFPNKYPFFSRKPIKRDYSFVPISEKMGKKGRIC